MDRTNRTFPRPQTHTPQPGTTSKNPESKTMTPDPFSSPICQGIKATAVLLLIVGLPAIILLLIDYLLDYESAMVESNLAWRATANLFVTAIQTIGVVYFAKWHGINIVKFGFTLRTSVLCVIEGFILFLITSWTYTGAALLLGWQRDAIGNLPHQSPELERGSLAVAIIGLLALICYVLLQEMARACVLCITRLTPLAAWGGICASIVVYIAPYWDSDLVVLLALAVSVGVVHATYFRHWRASVWPLVISQVCWLIWVWSSATAS
jgi:hypothetical protein